MDAKPLSIGKILSERQRFVVPIYQRTYSWTVRDQLEPLFGQIESKATELIDDGKVAFPHYMGALLLIPEGEAVFGRIQPFNIIDGQQRLTTFHICFAALRDLAVEYGFSDIAEQLADLVLHSDSVPMQNRVIERYKLQPSAYDQSLFHDLIDMRRAEIRQKHAEHFYKNGNLRGPEPAPLAAYWFIWTEAEGFITQDAKLADRSLYDASDLRKRLVALSTVLFEHFRLIVITMAKEDDAQVIFETLNSGGKPLAAMDLVRNDVFHRAQRKGEDQATLMERHWSVFETPFWKQEQTQGRIKKPRIDFFLAHVLSAESGKVVALGELYAEYKLFVASREFPSVAAEVSTLSAHAPTYRALIEPPATGALARLSRRLNTFDVSTAYPLIFVIAASDADEEVKDRLYDLVASYIIRRALCYLTAKNYNNVFAEVTSYLKVHGFTEAAFAAVFAAKTANEASRYPSDADLHRAILTRPQYGWIPQHRIKLLLEELEFASRDKFNINGTLQDGLQVEHVLPQKWQTFWPLPNEQTAPADLVSGVDEASRLFIERRQAAVHTLGNLTLLTPPGNALASNASFTEKQPRLVESLLKMNTAIAESQAWNEAEIEARGERLADLATRLWPAPLSAEADGAR